jgi:hypothetical protein
MSALMEPASDPTSISAPSSAAEPAAPSGGGGPVLAVMQLDLDAPDGPLVGPPEPTTVLALVRLHRHPLGVVESLVDTGHPFATRLRRAAVGELGPEILEHELRDRAARPMPWEHDAAPEPVPPCLRRRARLLGDPPSISVVIGTREQPERLTRCLASLAQVRYPRFEVLVVDSAPETRSTRRVVEAADGPVRYLRTRRSGRAAAHALGAAEATGRLLAFTGDDVLVDPDWLPAMAESFADPHVGCVAGLTMPAALSTPLRAMLGRRAEFAGGFEPSVFEAEHAGRERTPLPDGVLRTAPGVNMAFDADLARELPGFDPKALRAVSARAAYQPDAVVWHQYPEGSVEVGV